MKQKKYGSKVIKRTLLFTTVAAAAAVLLFVSLSGTLPGVNTSIVYAMEQENSNYIAIQSG